MIEQEWWESGWIRNNEGWKRAPKKPHLQFGHDSKENLKRLVEGAYRSKKRKDVDRCKREIKRMKIAKQSLERERGAQMF